MTVQVLVFNLGKGECDEDEEVIRGGGFLSLVVALSGCKPMHDRDSLDPVSAPERAMSDNGTMLTAMPGKDGGICMVRSSLRGEAKPELLTASGAIDDKQLKKALKFLSYGEQIATVVAGGIIGGAAVAGAGVAAAAGSPVLAAGAAAVGITSLVGGTFGYRIVKGNIEGERAAPIAVHSLFSGSILASPIVEYFTREGRLRKVLSDKEEYKFTDKRMLKLIANIKSIYPAYPGGCDHIKSQL